MSSRSRLLAFVSFVGLILLVACSDSVPTPIEPQASSGLRFSRSAERSSSEALDGAILSGRVYIFMRAAAETSKVAFYLDDARQPRQTEHIEPFDFAGTAAGGRAQPFDMSTLSEGRHTIRAVSTLASGGSKQVEATFEVRHDASANPPASGAADYALRGDPDFRRSQLSSDALRWYDRLWTALEHRSQYRDLDRLARQGDLYAYARPLNDAFTSLLVVFRATGDLALLDELDRLAQLMRKELRDTNGDGYLNWRWLADPDSRAYYGRDNHTMDEILTHANIAALAYVLHHNRDLRPGYGAHADFWRDYLINHYEAKWRERNRVARGYPFISREFLHPWTHQIRYQLYMYKLTGDTGRLSDAKRLTDRLFDDGGFVEVDTGRRQGYVWIHTFDPGYYYLQPATYLRYVIAATVDLHLEGFYRFADVSVVKKVSAGVADFWMDDADYASFASDIGGGRARGGVPSSSQTRLDDSTYAIGSYPLLAAWDAKVGRASEKVYNTLEGNAYGVNEPRRIFVPAAMVFRAQYQANR